VQQEIHTDANMRSTLRFLVCGSAADTSALADRLGANPGDAAGRTFATARRAFVAAEPHDLRALAAAAPAADLVILLVDAAEGLPSQARCHAMAASLFGIHHVVLAINEAADRAAFEHACESFRAFAGELAFKQIACIPVCTRDGDNIAARSARSPWYAGPPLLDYLETAEAADDTAAKPLRMAVEAVSASGFAGTIASGTLRVGEQIALLPAGQAATVRSLVGPRGDSAQVGDAVTVTLDRAVKAAPGDMLAAARHRPQVADQFSAHLVWLSAERLLPERSYLMQINHGSLPATVTALKHRVDTDSLAKLAARTLGANEIGLCNLSVAHPIAFDPYAENRATGAFLLLDRFSNETVAAGTIDFALRRAINIHHQHITVSKSERAALKAHKPAVLWFTGLSGAGKSTIANLVEAGLHARGVHTLLLDGDNIRHGLNRDLGFTEADRVENIRRIGEVAKLMTEAGLIVLCSFISPFRAERRMVRELVQEGEFVEVFVDTPLETCIARDPKGLYARALAGEIKNFTGVDQAYEVPEHAEIHLDAGHGDPLLLAERIIEDLLRRKIVAD
jgi:bifunctional enzyme CysN/CysC